MPLMGVLLEGKTAVLGLLAENPFPQASPCYVRARLCDYRFADPAQYQAGQWYCSAKRGSIARWSNRGAAELLQVGAGPLVGAGCYIDGDPVGVFDLESPLGDIRGVDDLFAAQTVGKDLVAHVQ